MTHEEGVGMAMGGEESVTLVTYTVTVGLGVPGYRVDDEDINSTIINNV